MNPNKYNKVAIILHWLIAVAFILMLASGIIMVNFDIERATKFSLYQWHKSLGVIVLNLVIIRILWRFTHTPPALPNSISKNDQKLAKIGHFALYIWMLILPLSGWLMASSSIYGIPTMVFNWFTWPHLPYVQADRNINIFAKQIHVFFAFSFIALLFLHIAALIKHRLKEKENLLKRIWF